MKQLVPILTIFSIVFLCTASWSQQVIPFPGIVIDSSSQNSTWTGDILNYGSITTDGPLELYNQGQHKEVVSGTGIDLTIGTTISSDNNTNTDLKIEKNNFDLAWFHPQTSSPAEVLKNDYVEIGIELDSADEQHIQNFVDSLIGPHLNPYDPDDVDIKATFYKRDGNGQWQWNGQTFGFYYQNFLRNVPGMNWIPLPTDHHMRLRYTPQSEGEYKCIIGVSINGGPEQYATHFHFTCVPSSLPGYMKIGANRNYFEVDGQTFFPMGPNLLPNSYQDTFGFRKKPLSYAEMHTHLATLKDAGGTYFRTFIGPRSYGLEFHNLNNYTEDLNLAWELDQLVDTASQLELKFHLNVMIHYALSEADGYGARHWDWTRFDDPVYDNAESGCSDPTDLGFCYRKAINSPYSEDFLTHPLCRVNFKKRLRYTIARWGYATSIGTIQLISELNKAFGDYDFYSTADTTFDDAAKYCSPYNPTGYDYYEVRPPGTPIPEQVGEWNIEMADYIKDSLLHNRHLVTASYSGLPMPEIGDLTIASDNIDFIDFNHYRLFFDTWYNLYSINYDYKVVKPLNFQFPNKPIMNSEISKFTCDNFTTWQKDVLLRPFTGMAGAMEWNFGNYGVWQLYENVKNFLSGFNLSGENWVPQRYISQDGKFDVVYLHKNQDVYIGAIHNRTWNFYTQKDSLDTTSQCYNDGKNLGSPFNLADEVISPIDGLATVHHTAGNAAYLVEFYNPFTGGSTNYPSIIWTTIADQGSHYLPFGFPNLTADNTMPIVYFVATLQSSSQLAPADDSLSQEATIAKIHRWQEEHPEEVQALATKAAPETETPTIVTPQHNGMRISAQPNPSQDQVRITIEGVTDIKGQCRLVNTNGKEVLQQKFAGSQFNISIENLPAGIYILFIETQQQQYQIKIVKA